ncbi:MAG: hypothetical protein V1773_15270 [bacterium]
MRYIFLISLFFSFLVISCSKEEEKLELFSPEAFCYSLEPGWELNSTVNVKGLVQKEKEGQFFVKVSYSVDLQLPDSTTKKDVYKNIIGKNDKEKVMYLALECQFELDSTYQKGDYTVIYNIIDDYSGKTASILKIFKVE